MSIFLGIDPGTTDTGFAVIQIHDQNKYSIEAFGIIHTPANQSIGQKMQEIETDIEHLLDTYNIEACGIEKIFYANNQKTIIDVAQSR